MGFHILFQIYAYLKNHNIDYFNLFFNNIFLAFQDQIIPQTKKFILLIWINGIEWTFAWMQLLGKIFIYICHFIGIYCIYCHGFYKDILMGVYHILWLLPFFLSTPGVSIIAPESLISTSISQMILYFYIKPKIYIYLYLYIKPKC